MSLIDVKTKLELIVCGQCGIDFAVPGHWVEARRNDHVSFYCPNGHCRVFKGKSEEEKLRDRLATERRTVEFWREQERKERLSHAATKGQLTKTRKRVAKGVCPECNRHFANVEKHMRGQHPSMAEAVE